MMMGRVEKKEKNRRSSFMTADGLRIHQAVCARVPTAVGEFQLCLYTNNRDEKEHLALVNGDVYGQENVLVRIHSECFTGDVLGSRRCDCGEQLEHSMELIALDGCGVIIYLRQEGRGIGLAEKLRAYNLQDHGLDTVDANLALGHPVDDRDYSMAAAIIRDLGMKSVRLITNNPTKIDEMEKRGIKVTDRIALIPTIYQDNMNYLVTKIQRMNHLLNLSDFILPVSNRTHGSD
jgi:3,4-dihydroxy 2-butanone 4-phosphate synthase/GTP cyclohydrolase II